MALLTLISAIVPAQGIVAPHLPAPAQAIAPVQQQTASEGASLRHPPHQHERQPRRQSAPLPESEGESPAHAQVTALIAVAEQLVDQANAAGGGAARASELTGKMTTAAARYGLELRGALVVAERDDVQLGSGSVYQRGTWVAAFSGAQVSFMRSPTHIDRRM